ncbi:MAG: thioredoxin [bacterium]|nr:thioredoxin [bacterium]
MSIKQITGDNFNSHVLQAKGKVLVDFWAPWCGPCKMQTPILEKLVESNEVTAAICKVNTDEAPEIAQKFEIASMPTLIVFENGMEVERMVGAQPEKVLKQKLQ